MKIQMLSLIFSAAFFIITPLFAMEEEDKNSPQARQEKPPEEPRQEGAGKRARYLHPQYPIIPTQNKLDKLKGMSQEERTQEWIRRFQESR